VVDDEPSVLESFRQILKIKDYEVDTFPNGSSAVAAMEKGKYELAFIDMILPWGAEQADRSSYGGLDVLKKVKEIDPDCEVVIVTAYGSESTHANAITLGAMEYLRKPFLMEEIYELVDRGLRRKRSKATRREGGEGGPPLAGIH
jgi:DNA-binding NtrC family response regulator